MPRKSLDRAVTTNAPGRGEGKKGACDRMPRTPATRRVPPEGRRRQLLIFAFPSLAHELGTLPCDIQRIRPQCGSSVVRLAGLAAARPPAAPRGRTEGREGPPRYPAYRGRGRAWAVPLPVACYPLLRNSIFLSFFRQRHKYPASNHGGVRIPDHPLNYPRQGVGAARSSARTRPLGK